MPSKIIDAYRQQLANQGLTDPRDDYFLVQEIGPIVQQEAPHLFDQDPGLGELWSEIRDANAPSLAAETGRAFRGGLKGLASTAVGGASLLTGSDYLRNKAAALDASAAEDAPTIGTLEEITPGRHGVSKVLSRDALRYALSKVGQVAPSIAEAGVTGLIGAAAGSAAAPGPGTIAGAAEGVIARSFIKSAIRSLVKKGIAEEMVTKGLLKEATEVGLEQALKSGSKEVADVVSRQAISIGAQRGLGAANLANSYLLNAGDVYSEGGDRPTALALGLVSAIPDSALPTYLLGRLFPGVAASKARELGKMYLADRTKKLLEAAGVVAVEGGTEYFQEGVNVVARNIKEGKDPLTFTDADMRRFREAGIAGAFGGGLAAPSLFFEGNASEVPAKPAPPAPGQPAPAAPLASAPAAPVPVVRSNADIVRAVQAMAPEQQTARLEELGANAARSPEEETEYQLLQATAPRVEPQPAVSTVAEPVTEPAPDVLPPGPAVAESAPVSEVTPAPAVQGELPLEAAPAEPVQPVASSLPPAPATYVGTQDLRPAGIIELYNLTEDIPGHPKGSSVDRRTLEAAGFFVPPKPEVEPVPTTPEVITTPAGVAAAETTPHLQGGEVATKYMAEIAATPLPKGVDQEIDYIAGKDRAKGKATVYGNWAILKNQSGKGYAVVHVPSGLKAGGGSSLAEAKEILKAYIHSGVDASSPTLSTDKAKMDILKEVAQVMHAGLKKDFPNAPSWFTPKGAPAPAAPAEPVTQEQRVKQALTTGPKTIQELAEQLDIINHNIRRILGVGAKAGKFERIGRGVYAMKNPNGSYIYVESTDSVAALPELAKRGVKADFFFLDPPYKTVAIKGGNRGVKNYQFISPDQFNTIVQAAKTMMRTPDSPIYYMHSKAPSGLKEMQRYNEVFQKNGLKLVAKGNWNKTFNDGKPVTNVRGVPAQPEGIALFNQSGKLPKATLPTLDFTMIRPPVAGKGGRQSQKPVELYSKLLGFHTEDVPAEKRPNFVSVDSFAGTGGLAEASQQHGISSIALELDEDVIQKFIGPRLEAGVRNAPPEPPPSAPPPPAVSTEPTIEKPAAEPVAAQPFEHGAVIEGSPSVDFRTNEQFANLTGEQWDQLLTASLESGPRSDKTGNRSLTRVAVAMQAPDGRVIVAGLTLPQKTLTTGGSIAFAEAAVQRMGVTRDSKRAVEGGGNHPATVRDIVAAGYKPLAVLHFAGEPGKIFQSFADQKAFDTAWGATEKTQGQQIRPPAMTAQPAIARNREADLYRQIDQLGSDYLRAKDQATKNSIREQLTGLYAELDRVTNREQGQAGDQPLPEYRQQDNARAAVQQDTQQASRAAEFQAVMTNLKNMGMKVDVFGQEIFAQSAREPIVGQIDQLKAQLAGAQGSQRTDILHRIAQRETRLAELEKAVGVAYSPWHVAVSVQDVQHANLGNLVTLLHEAAESLTMRLNPVAKGVVLRAVDASIAELQGRAAEASAKTGVPVSTTTSASDLLAETMAQRLAAAGVQDAPSLAQAIVRWVKDLYYRVAMAVQRAFGAEPDIDTALGWFENQLRRETGGDIDYRLADLMGRFVAVPMVEQVRRFTGAKDTPGGVADFFDPLANRIDQPWVEPTSDEALRWNIEFRQADGLGDQNIPDPEARARIDAASLGDILEFGTRLHKEVAPDMPWADFWKLVGRGDDPTLLLAEQGRRFPGAETARIGGERMTKPMNDLASLNARILTEKIQLRQLRELAKARRQIDEASAKLVETAKDINKMEADVRNAALHEDTLKAKMKEMAKGLVQAIRRGLDTAHTHGRLAEAIRQAEGLMENDPIPDAYQRLLKTAADGTLPLFDSIRALAELDLPLVDMTNSEIVRAIRANAEANPQLQAMATNRPLAVSVAELARSNVEQVDQIQLGWLRDTTQFLEIHQKLDEIRRASVEEVREMARQTDERARAKGLLERLRVGYLRRRRALQTQQNRIQVAEERAAIIEKALPPTAARVAEMQQSAGGSYSEWYPIEGARFTAMVQDEEGNFTSERRTLSFNPDGSARDSDQVKRDVAANFKWLQANTNRKGTRLFEQVKRQTMELAMLDVQRKYPAGWVNMLDRMVQPIGAEARAAGHSAGARIAQMLQQFEFITRSHRDQAAGAAGAWTRAFTDLEESTGITDHGKLLSQLYDPVVYFLNVNPGLDEQHAIREATRLARQLLPKPPADNFNERFANFLRRTKENSEMMLRIAEQYGVFVKDPRLSGSLREAVAQGWLTTPRSLRADVVQTLVRDMQAAGWKLQFKEEDGPQGASNRSVVRATTFDGLSSEDLSEQNSRQLSAVLKRYFTPGILDRWLVPFINKPGSEIFSWGGDPIPQLEVQQAWGRAGGDVLRFIDNLADSQQLEIPEEADEGGDMPDPLANFRGHILGQIDRLFGMEARLAYESQQVRDLFDPMGPKPHALMDARLNDLLPPEHVQFQAFDPTSSQRLLGMLAFHGAFGRNGERMIQTVSELKGALQGRKAEFDSLKGTTRGARAAEAAARGLDYRQLEAAADRYAGVIDMQSKLRGLFGVGNTAGPFADLRGGMELMNAMAGQIVDQPKVGAYNLLSIAMRPFAMRSLGPMTIGASVRAYSNFLTTTLGSFLENLNVHLMHSSEYAKDVGSVEGQLFRNLPWGTVLADIGHRGRFQTSKTDQWLIRPLRALRAIQRKGVRVGIGEGAREFPRLAMIPGLGVLNSISQIAAQSNTMASVQMVERIVRQGITYFNNHPTDLHDPAFRFTAAKLGIGKLDTGVFDYLRNKTVEYGLGNLEDMVRQAVPAAAKGDRLLTRDQVLRLAQMTANELDGASSINTTPAVLQTNPVLKIGMPLLRWPLWMMHAVHEGINTADGQRTLFSMARGLGTLALWNLPMGIAFSLMMDQYDDKILHKKSNQRPVDSVAAIPLVGPALALAAGDHGWDNAMGMLERGARAGNIYGLGADLAAQVLAPYDPNSGQRSFSMDQRILVMSQFLNFQQAIRNLIAQGGDATWASFWRPAMLAIGGNGVLHSVDISNNLLGLDNAESRLVQRINAQNWLRSAGREVGLELRPAAGATSAPSPMSVHTREMQLAAMANDRLGFLDEYRKALNAAREQVADDPRIPPVEREKEAQTRVLASWAARDPLEVFRFKPTAAQVAQLYSVMEDSGRADTQEAIRRFDSFSQLITPSPIDRFFTRQTSQLTRDPTRMRQANSGLLFSTR